jgi:hypothetical protein
MRPALVAAGTELPRPGQPRRATPLQLIASLAKGNFLGRLGGRGACARSCQERGVEGEGEGLLPVHALAAQHTLGDGDTPLYACFPTWIAHSC